MVFNVVFPFLVVFENKDKIILVQEFADGGELYDYISTKGRLTEKEARLLFRQIVSAVHYLHEVRRFLMKCFVGFVSTSLR